MNNVVHLKLNEMNHLNEMVTVMATRKPDVAELIAMRLSLDAEWARQSTTHHDQTGELPDLWERLLELAHDSDANVRHWAVEAMRDGSPAKHRSEIIGKLMLLAEDVDVRVRRSARQALETYRKESQMSFFNDGDPSGAAK
jgi:hypothetical protein